MASSAARIAKSSGTTMSVEFRPEELELLTSLAADQLFRREFIDPKMPGFRRDTAQLDKAKELVSRLKAVLDGGVRRTLPRIAGR